MKCRQKTYRLEAGRWLAVALAIAASTGLALGAGQGEPGPVYPIEIRLADRIADLRLLAEMRVDVDAVFGDRARAYVVAEEEEKLALLGFDLARIPDEVAPAVGGETGGLAPRPTYHTYATLTSELQSIAQAHPEITRLFSAGKSVQGRDLWIMKITDDPGVEEDEPEVRYLAAMHGDEVVGKENCVNFINLLVDGYGVDPRITSLVNEAEIWILPSMNPDGTELRQRYNVNGYDLNRDFPDQFEDPVDSPAGRQPETAAVMNWGYSHSPVLSANFHGGTVVANYPYDGTANHASVYHATPDDPLFVSLARTYADRNPSMLGSNSDPSYNNGICNGADWYVVYGGLQDWGYVWHGNNEITMEISQAKWPAADQLPTFWDQNREAMLAYLERVFEGVRGVVTDDDTGAPVGAVVRVGGISHDVYTDPELGDFHRMLLAGRYDLEVSATGYVAALIRDVDVPPGGEVRRDVRLRPLATSLQPVSHRVLDGVSGNGQLDAGESADLAVTLRNLGAAATDVAASIEPTGWYGSVTRASATYPDLSPGASGESSAPHHGVALASDTPVGHKAGFVARWSSDQGFGTSDPFFVETGTPTCTTVDSTDVPKAVLDRKTASSTLAFQLDGETSDVRVRVDIDHTYIGDLTVTVLSPSGIPVVLHNRTGGSMDDILGWYGTDLAPAEPLSRLRGEASAGTWTLKVNDGVPSNQGSVLGWSLEVCGRSFESTTPEMRFADLSRTAEGVRLRWWPYPGLTSYRVYRSDSPANRADFGDVTSQDPDPTDLEFLDASTSGTLFWLVTGVGPAGEGPR